MEQIFVTTLVKSELESFWNVLGKFISRSDDINKMLIKTKQYPNLVKIMPNRADAL
jgi:hypothetical protein